MVRASTDRKGASYLAADSGCEMHPLCLTCPLEYCVLDMPDRYQWRLRTRARLEEMARRVRAGARINDIAAEFGVSRRTVSRAIEETR